MTEIVPLDARRHAQDLRDTWQARALAESRGKTAAVVMAVLFHSYKEAMQILLRVVFPKAPIAKNGWTEISRPFYYGAARIVKTGQVVCGMIDRDGRDYPSACVYAAEAHLIREFRLLADRLKLNDEDRVQMTEAVKRWVVADLRVDHMSRKIAS